MAGNNPAAAEGGSGPDSALESLYRDNPGDGSR